MIFCTFFLLPMAVQLHFNSGLFVCVSAFSQKLSSHFDILSRSARKNGSKFLLLLESSSEQITWLTGMFKPEAFLVKGQNENTLRAGRKFN